MSDHADEEGLDDLEERELCPDGACVGVIGPDGRCKVCGRPGEGGAKGAAAGGGAVGNGTGNSTGTEAQAAGSKRDGDEEDILDRELCPDGACIGVLGSDGKCKVCGRTAAS